MIDLSDKLYVSTISDDAAELARTYGLGVEIAEFCTAFNMDRNFEIWDAGVKLQMQGVERFIFHAPFNELCPAAIDPLIVEVAKKRYAQACALMRGYGINTMIVHSGFIPILYDETWFAANSIEFWKEFISDKPDGFNLYLENVFEQTPGMLREIARGVNDEKFRLCFDVGHAGLYCDSVSLVEWAEQVTPFLGHVHLHNNNGENDTHNVLSDGKIDVAAIIKKILREAPQTTFTIEAVGGKPSLEWLKAGGFLP